MSRSRGQATEKPPGAGPGVHGLAQPLPQGVTSARTLIFLNCSFIINSPRGNMWLLFNLLHLTFHVSWTFTLGNVKSSHATSKQKSECPQTLEIWTTAFTHSSGRQRWCKRSVLWCLCWRVGGPGPGCSVSLPPDPPQQPPGRLAHAFPTIVPAPQLTTVHGFCPRLLLFLRCSPESSPRPRGPPPQLQSLWACPSFPRGCSDTLTTSHEPPVASSRWPGSPAKRWWDFLTSCCEY